MPASPIFKAGTKAMCTMGCFCTTIVVGSKILFSLSQNLASQCMAASLATIPKIAADLLLDPEHVKSTPKKQFVSIIMFCGVNRFCKIPWGTNALFCSIFSVSMWASDTVCDKITTEPQPNPSPPQPNPSPPQPNPQPHIFPFTFQNFNHIKVTDTQILNLDPQEIDLHLYLKHTCPWDPRYTIQKTHCVIQNPPSSKNIDLKGLHNKNIKYAVLVPYMLFPLQNLSQCSFEDICQDLEIECSKLNDCYTPLFLPELHEFFNKITSTSAQPLMTLLHTGLNTNNNKLPEKIFLLTAIKKDETKTSHNQNVIHVMIIDTAQWSSTTSKRSFSKSLKPLNHNTWFTPHSCSISAQNFPQFAKEEEGHCAIMIGYRIVHS